ncbi:hypothetical protein [Streptomyces albidoflavus]|uniref:hypothetical protein n=1 Tax=Streptomyces albidoflavus TaxID=1886 RepID=UPI001021A37A|nr:hypothetical protein [Streptomyces albidoflavus]RZF02863.1 hypothetical protein C0R05_32125 [Streptomyces albidoflavus]
MTRRTMKATERAARDILNDYVRTGLISRATANDTIRQGLTIAETAVRNAYNHGQTYYYAGKIAEAREKHEAARGDISRRMAAGWLMMCEMTAAIYKAVQAEHADALAPEDTVDIRTAEQVMREVRDAARELREEAAPTQLTEPAAA